MTYSTFYLSPPGGDPSVLRDRRARRHEPVEDSDLPNPVPYQEGQLCFQLLRTVEETLIERTEIKGEG